MPQTPQQVLADLQNKTYAPVYFLQGEEPYYIDLIADYIENHVISEAEKGFNLLVLYGKEQTMGQVITHARRFPMIAQRQVVMVKEAQNMPDLKKEVGYKLLENYLKKPQPATLLVFVHKHTQLDGRKLISKLLGQYAVVVNSTKLYDNQIPTWVTQYVKEKKLKIMPKATVMLQAFVGNHLQRLARELDKVMLNLNQGATIDDAIVQKYVGISKDYNVFELQKALAKKDIKKIYYIIQHFQTHQSKALIIPTVAFLFTFFNKLLLVHQTKEKSTQHLAKVLQVHPYFVFGSCIIHYKKPWTT